MLRILGRLFALKRAPSPAPPSSEPPASRPVVMFEITTSVRSHAPPRIDTGPLTETPLGWLLNPRCSFKITVTGITRHQALELKTLLDEPSTNYYEGRKRLSGFISRHNLRWKELDEYIDAFKPIYLASIEAQKTASNEWDEAAEPDRRDLLEGFRAKALQSLDVRPFSDVDALFEDDLADATIDDALLERYGMDLMEVYLRRSGDPQKVHRLDAQAYERKAFEQLVEQGLACRGSDIRPEQILFGLTLKELNALANAPKPFGRKAKAVEYLLAQPDVSSRVAGALSFRELFQLRPLPPEFSSLDLRIVSQSWRRAAEIGGLLAHTYAANVSALRHVENDREYVDGWQILATDDSCPACQRAAKKKYSKSKPPPVPVHVGCRCCLSPVIR